MKLNPHGIDHLVQVVDDLDAARSSFARMGFTVAPVARHPFGTANAVVQFGNHAYLELLTVVDPDKIVATTDEAFSFGAFNRACLAEREGLSMVALRSENGEADRARFLHENLPAWPLFSFSRMAMGPDGIERELGFTMITTSEPRLPRAGFFACEHHHPENFWHETYQRHANGATALTSIVLVAPDPADFHEFLTYYTGQHDMSSDSLGIAFELGGTRIEVMSPVAYEAFFATDAGPVLGRFGAFRVTVPDLAAAARVLGDDQVPFRDIANALVVAPEFAHGAVVAFHAAETPSAR